MPPRLPKLLLVDDQPLNIQTLFPIFSADHEVFMATSGEQALKVCASRRPDLILLDVMMPDMDGHEVCRRLKADPTTRDIPVIFVTAHSDPEEESLGLLLGAVDFISKPVNAVVVRARVKSHLLLRSTLAQIQNLNEDLEARVFARTRELERTLEQLRASQDSLASSEAKATLSLLVASVSHEMGTPLGNSVMAASTLADQAAVFQGLVDAGTMKKSDFMSFLATVREGTGMIQKNLTRANDLLGHFRQVAADQASEQRRVFDLADTVSEILHTLKPSLKRYPHRVVLEIDAGILMDSQPGALGQVVINLINNAYLHAFENIPSGLLNVRAHASASRVHMVVSDNGNGIEPDNMSRLFEPFFSTKIGHGGTGLGLAIVHNLVVKTLGGEIRVSSVPGQGTQFDIELPQTLA
jgi:signal transduction histidine kinase